jgi:aryl-alcohol dehydrogenase-like predicted oxidoreductase
VQANLAAADIELDDSDLAEVDAAFPPPVDREPLTIV